MPVPARDVVFHLEVERFYRSVERAAFLGRQPQAAVWKGVRTAMARLRVDLPWGEVIPRIPPYFVQRYGVEHLYCADLASFHRMFYTVHDQIVILLDLVDHRTYDKWFGRKRP